MQLDIHTASGSEVPHVKVYDITGCEDPDESRCGVNHDDADLVAEFYPLRGETSMHEVEQRALAYVRSEVAAGRAVSTWASP